MHGPDGVDYPNKTVYHEVEKYSKLVYDHGGYDDRPPLFKVTVTFNEVKGKTKMEMTMGFATPEICEEMTKFIKKAGGNGTWDRLGEFLAKEIESKDKFIINRSFDAPINVMYEMWTNPEHFAKWLPPTGATMELIKADVHPGGHIFYCMLAGPTLKMYGRVDYLEFAKPNHIKYTQQFTDEKGNLSRHPMAPTWPESMLTIVTLTEEGPDQTRVTVTWEPAGKVTKEELETFLKERGGMTEGWTGSFDKLEAYLEER